MDNLPSENLIFLWKFHLPLRSQKISKAFKGNFFRVFMFRVRVPTSILDKWDKIFLPIGKGGLGLHSIKDKSPDLLSKWSWSYQKEKEALRWLTNNAKFGTDPLNNLPGSFSLCTSSGPWMNAPVGNGASTDFWHDSWLTGRPLALCFSKLFSVSTRKMALAKD